MNILIIYLNNVMIMIYNYKKKIINLNYYNNKKMIHKYKLMN